MVYNLSLISKRKTIYSVFFYIIMFVKSRDDINDIQLCMQYTIHIKDIFNVITTQESKRKKVK